MNAPGGRLASVPRDEANGRDSLLRADPARHPVRAADRGVGVGAPDAHAARDAPAGRRVAGEGDRRAACARGGARVARRPAAAQARCPGRRSALSQRHPQRRSRRRLTCHRRPPCPCRPRCPGPIPEPRVVERPLPETPRTPPVPADRRRRRRRRRLCHRRSRPLRCSPRSRRGRQRRRCASASTTASAATQPPSRSGVRLGEPRRREAVLGDSPASRW